MNYVVWKKTKVWPRCVCPSERKIKRRLAVAGSGVGKGVLSACEAPTWLPPPQETTAALTTPQPPRREAHRLADLSPLRDSHKNVFRARGRHFSVEENPWRRRDTGEERGPGEEATAKKTVKGRLVSRLHVVRGGKASLPVLWLYHGTLWALHQKGACPCGGGTGTFILWARGPRPRA